MQSSSFHEVLLLEGMNGDSCRAPLAIPTLLSRLTRDDTLQDSFDE